MKSVPITFHKTRLHFINQDSILIFDMLNLTKRKHVISFDKNLWPLAKQDTLNGESLVTETANIASANLNLWNQQSIECNGKIYMCGGAIAGTKTYLKTMTMLDEFKWQFVSGLANMNHARDAHGITTWKNRYIIVVGSWHVESSRKTCEIYDTFRNTWTELPTLNDETCAPGLVIVKNRYLYKLGGATDVGKVEVLDLSLINFRD